jgi:hypothetical protein
VVVFQSEFSSVITHQSEVGDLVLFRIKYNIKHQRSGGAQGVATATVRSKGVGKEQEEEEGDRDDDLLIVRLWWL